MFRAGAFLKELKNCAPDIFASVKRAVEKSVEDKLGVVLDRNEFEQARSISVDYAVMEHTSKAAIVQIQAKWMDFGSWESFYEAKDKDENGNVIEGDVISIDTRGCYINSSDRLIATIGLKDLAVLETKDAVLITQLNRSQDVREVVSRLKSIGRPEVEVTPIVLRPWGSFEGLIKEQRFQVKKIIVKTGEELSLQKHYHRSEHWIVCQGSAEVLVDNKLSFLTEGQSVFIPTGIVHQLRNPGKVPLIVIEVQIGCYLEEDDIVRLSDKYSRD